jgi:hypothetical protein
MSLRLHAAAAAPSKGRLIRCDRLRLQIFARRMPIYMKGFRNRIGRLAHCRSSSDLMTQFSGEPRPTDLDALRLCSRHASFCSFADLLRLDFG